MFEHGRRQSHDGSISRRRPRGGATIAVNERRTRGRVRQSMRLGPSITALSFAMLLVAFSACTTTAPPAPGSFIEEFDGFLIFHGDPGRSYRVLGGVYRPEAAERGVSPMKRAAVAEARRLGANAILIGPPPAPTLPSAPQLPAAGAAGAENKWEYAVAIELLD